MDPNPKSAIGGVVGVRDCGDLHWAGEVVFP